MSAARLADLKQLRSNMKGDTLMTIEQLKKYRDICAEIADIEAELNDKHYVADTVSVCTPPSYTAHSKRIDGFPPKGNTLSLLAELSALRAQQREIEEYINSIEDWQTRKMFKLRFIDGFSWIQVAHKVGGNTADSCRMKIKRYLQNS